MFADFGLSHAEVEQVHAVLAARIITILDEQGLSVRKAGELTGFAAADFSRIRQAKLDRCTIDRLMMMLTRLGQKIDITLDVRPREMAT